MNGLARFSWNSIVFTSVVLLAAGLVLASPLAHADDGDSCCPCACVGSFCSQWDCTCNPNDTSCPPGTCTNSQCGCSFHSEAGGGSCYCYGP